MARVLMIIAQKNFRDEELLITREVLEHAGHKVKVASVTRMPADGMLGAKITPDFALHEVNADFYDAIVVVGGAGTASLLDTEAVMLVRNMNEQGKLVAGICLGPIVLAKASALVDKKATVFKTKDAIAMLKNNGAIYKDEPLVVDGHIVTADGPQSAGIFGKKIAELLKK